MLKQTQRSSEIVSKEAQQDIQFLLSNIRARENGLIFFLERFSSECKSEQQLNLYKQQFLQKEKIYANQVSRIIAKFLEQKRSNSQLEQFTRTFWIKVKSIIKVSLDRLRMLKLLNERIFNRYEEIIYQINRHYDEEKSLQDFIAIENLLKKRNVDALIYSRTHFSPISDTKIAKNRSESAFKQNKFSPNPKFFEQSFVNEYDQNFGKLKLEQQNDKSNENRMKSLNGYRRKKLAIETKSIQNRNIQKNYKKIMKNGEKIEKSLEGAMEGSFQINLDKKKSMKENQETIYDQLFKRNIPNHKMISKFVFGACGIAEFLLKRKKFKAKLKGYKNEKEIKQIERKLKSHTRQGKEREREKVREKEKDKNCKQKSKDRPQSSLTAQIKGIFQQEKRRMIQTTMVLQSAKSSKYRKKIGVRLEKYSKIVRLVS